MPIPVTAIVVSAAAVGAFAQRSSGLGFSLIAAPALALAVGPREGVALTNVLSMVVALAVLATSARQLDVARSAVLVPAGLAGVIPGAVVFGLLPAGPLQIAVGAVTGLGLGAVALARRLRITPRPGSAAVAGLASGFTTAVAGAGGPALTVYAVATGWPQPQFAATGQASYATQAALALAIRGLPSASLTWLAVIMVGALCGLTAGHYAARHIDPARARQAAISLATVSTLLTLLHGMGFPA